MPHTFNRYAFAPLNSLQTNKMFFAKLPDDFKDFATRFSGGKAPSDSFFTHCHRESFHEQWKVLLDEEFLQAYEHGIIIKCCDGITRRFYPRIFTYSADYPEKYRRYLDHPSDLLTVLNRVLIASIRNLGRCPCPRCLIPLSQVNNVGTQSDMLQRRSLIRTDTQQRQEKVAAARKLIYQKNYAVDNTQVQALLKDESLVPTSVCEISSDSSIIMIISFCRMHSLKNFRRWASIFFVF